MYNFIRTHLAEVRHYPGKEMRTIYGYITIAALTVLTAGCGISRLQAPAGAGRDAGPFVTRVYEGHIQCIHGQERTCRLTVRHRLHSGDGTFRLILKQDGKGTERYSGRRFTLRGQDRATMPRYGNASAVRTAGPSTFSSEPTPPSSLQEIPPGKAFPHAGAHLN